MRIRVLSITLACLLCAASAPRVFAQADQDVDFERTKFGQTGMQFLSVSVDPRSAAMADAVTALEWGSGALFYNPAAMAQMDQRIDVTLGQNQWITDIGYSFGSVAFQPFGGRFGTVGVSVMAVDYGSVQGTIRADNDAGYLDTELIEPSALSVGAGYARALTDRFSVGGQVKYVRQSLGSVMLNNTGESGEEWQDLEKGTAAFDFGVLYRTGFRSLNFALNVRNFAGELTYAETSFELPLTFRIGLSMDMVDFTNLNAEVHTFRVGLDAAHPRAFKEQLKLGGEYVFMNTLALRAGYIFPSNEQGLNLGVGLQQSLSSFGLGFDYAYSDFGLFGNVHRLALRLAFD